RGVCVTSVSPTADDSGDAPLAMFAVEPQPPPRSTLFPYTTLFRSLKHSTKVKDGEAQKRYGGVREWRYSAVINVSLRTVPFSPTDRKSTRLNSSHVKISYAVVCLKKKNNAHLNKAQLYVAHGRTDP